MEQSRIEDYLRDKLSSVPLESFLGNIPTKNLAEEIQQMSLLTEENRFTEGETFEDEEDDF